MHATMPQIRKPTKRAVRPRKLRFVIGLADSGRRMSLEQFSRASVQPGFVAELANGVIEVSGIPDYLHSVIVRRILQRVGVYCEAHPDVIAHFAAGSDAKIELWGRESERHPDVSIYLTFPPEDVRQPWDRWMPEIAIEVVSASSGKRDHEEKPDDYLAAGVKEYWIVDPRKKSALIHTRRGDGWLLRKLGRRSTWQTQLLPGFKLDLGKLFDRIPKGR